MAKAAILEKPGEGLVIGEIGGEIEYVPFPDGLAERYQSYTQADLTELRAAGYDAPFTPLEVGVPQAVAAWEASAALPDWHPGCWHPAPGCACVLRRSEFATLRRMACAVLKFSSRPSQAP